MRGMAASAGATQQEEFGVMPGGLPQAVVRPVQAGVMMQAESTLTCPKCGHRTVETMPTDACQFFYDCKGCGERLKPLAGDCCVFCSYGSVPCPPIQQSKGCCCSMIRKTGIHFCG